MAGDIEGGEGVMLRDLGSACRVILLLAPFGLAFAGMVFLLIWLNQPARSCDAPNVEREVLPLPPLACEVDGVCWYQPVVSEKGRRTTACLTPAELGRAMDLAKWMRETARK